MTHEPDSSWAEAQAHLLAQPMSDTLRAWIASDTPMRPAYITPGHPVTRTVIPQPWLALREEEPSVYGSASAGELALAWLAREFGRAVLGVTETSA